MRQHIPVLVVVTALALGLTPQAFGAGGGGGGGSGGSGGGSGGGGGNSGGGGTNSGQADVKVCKKGFVYNKKTKKCVVKESILLPDADLIEQAWTLARSGEFEAGRLLLSSVADKNKPEVLNGLGYTNRKLGQFNEAIAYYNQAISLDPNYAEAREYLGEGYVVLGKLDLAKEQLAEIKRICGTSCEEYAELNEAIEEAVKAATTE
jgi:tetratricopeptide (TPR) repeat protein